MYFEDAISRKMNCNALEDLRFKISQNYILKCKFFYIYKTQISTLVSTGLIKVIYRIMKTAPGQEITPLKLQMPMTAINTLTPPKEQSINEFAKTSNSNVVLAFPLHQGI